METFVSNSTQKFNLFQIGTLIILILMASSCGHDILDVLEEDLSGYSLNQNEVAYIGTFKSANNYTVNGTVLVIEENDRKYLVFQNFKSSSGPDLKVYISKESRPADHVSLGALKAVSGNFSYDIPDTISFIGGGTFVLVYCERYSRLFGYGELQTKPIGN